MRPVFRVVLPCTAAAAVLLTLVPADAEAAARRGLPPGLLGRAAAIDRVERLEMPPVDVAAFRTEDVRRQRSGRPTPLRFAAALDADLSPGSAGTWEQLADGSALWRLRVASPGALSLNLAFEPFDLPAGAALWLYDSVGTMVRGPYTRDDRNAAGALWTPVVLGDEVVVELHLPPGVERPGDLRISRVNHGYRSLGEAPAPDGATKQGSCNIDVICPQGDVWRDQIRSTARISILGAFLCSAQLVNTTAEDGTPYLLTAQHCVEDASQATSVVAFWNFESPQCGLLAGGNLSQSQSGATLVALWEWRTGSDFALVRLDAQPDPAFNVYYAGWDATGATPAGSVGIHHPSGDEKAMSFDDDPPIKESYYGFGSHQWRIAAWDLGTTEGGSSGSCIYDNHSQRCVGTLTAGTASCATPNGYDIYGRMDAHWAGDGSPSGRLSDWLDPLGSGTRVLDGRNPGGGSGQTWLVPAAASTPGAGTSNWKSQLVVSNPTDELRQARVFFVPRGSSWPGALLSGPHAVPAGGSLFLDDPLLPLNPTSGLLYFTVDGRGTLVTTRTYNLAAGGGTFGQGIPGILLDEAVAADELILPMVHSVPGRFRTNLGLVQASAGSMAVRVQVHASDGTVLATKGYASSDAYLQVNDLFRDMGLETLTVEGAWLSVQLIGGAPAYWTAYASVVDDDTDDPTYILPVAR